MRQTNPVKRCQPTLIYDGDCAFCTSAVRLAERWLQPACVVVALQEIDFPSWQLQRRAADEVLWVTSTGAVHGGAEAVARLLIAAGGVWSRVGAVMIVPPTSWLATGLYAAIARNRNRLPGGTPACALPPDRRPGAHGT